MANSAFLRTRDAAALVGMSVDTLKKKRRAGVFREGEHFFRPDGTHPKWDVVALRAWLTGASSCGDGIPMARGTPILHGETTKRGSDNERLGAC
jgi:hypothetical protein